MDIYTLFSNIPLHPQYMHLMRNHLDVPRIPPPKKQTKEVHTRNNNKINKLTKTLLFNNVFIYCIAVCILYIYTLYNISHMRNVYLHSYHFWGKCR